MQDDAKSPIDVDGLDADLIAAVRDVETYGTHVVQVDGADADDSFSYTIGLEYHYDHPELVVFGRKPGWRRWLLNAVRDEILGGLHFEPGLRYAGILEHARLAVTPVPEGALSRYCERGQRFYRAVAPGRASMRALQLVWPDASDLLPWEPGYRAEWPQAILEGM